MKRNIRRSLPGRQSRLRGAQLADLGHQVEIAVARRGVGPEREPHARLAQHPDRRLAVVQPRVGARAQDRAARAPGERSMRSKLKRAAWSMKRSSAGAERRPAQRRQRRGAHRLCAGRLRRGVGCARGVRRVTEALAGLEVEPLAVAELLHFQNVNTPEDWARYAAK